MPAFSLTPFEQVVPRIWRAVAEPAGVTVGLVVGDSGALVIDTGSSPAQGRLVREAAQAVTDVPLVAAVVTHDHWDHLYGLAGFADLRTFAHESVAVTGDEVARNAAELGFDPAELVAPNAPFALAKTVDLGGLRAELVHFGPGHTAGDVVVIVPDAHVVFAGDLLEESAPPQLGSDADVNGWPSAVDGILGVLGEDWLVIPGHGRPVDRFFAFNQRAQVAGVIGQATQLIGQGVRQEDALAAAEWPFPDEAVEPMLATIYAQLAARGVRPRPQLPLL